MGPPAHPNEVDRKRIERALKSRQRYRYVTPRVVAVPSGYRVESPCCSRNIDANGGIVDVALVLYDDDRVRWQLFRKDHKQAIWDLDNSYGGLDELLERLNADPERKFWQ
ncbi:hypothetical protein MXD81_41620 [Microbacteriaceae bacterium K1510]|nr:hypothetical protein [Microbacteriaceae bacterium K1510]